VNEAKTPIRATLEVRQSDKTLELPSMPVTIDAPVGTSAKYDIIIDRPAVQNLKLIGPPATIDAIDRQQINPPPKARLVVTGTDLMAVTGERQSKVVVYDLPKDVHVSPEDEKKTVEFRIVDRPTTGAP
jgi:hypothetical protein